MTENPINGEHTGLGRPLAGGELQRFQVRSYAKLLALEELVKVSPFLEYSLMPIMLLLRVACTQTEPTSDAGLNPVFTFSTRKSLDERWIQILQSKKLIRVLDDGTLVLASAGRVFVETFIG